MDSVTKRKILASFAGHITVLFLLTLGLGGAPIGIVPLEVAPALLVGWLSARFGRRTRSAFVYGAVHGLITVRLILLSVAALFRVSTFKLSTTPLEDVVTVGLSSLAAVAVPGLLMLLTEPESAASMSASAPMPALAPSGIDERKE